MDNEIKTKIVDAAIAAFNSDGSRFTMDEVASSLSMSKKTIYKYFDSKEDLILAAVNMGFDQVKVAESAIINDPKLDIIEKIKRTIVVIPEKYSGIDWRRLYEFKDAYPEAFKTIQDRIESGWDGTIELLNQAVKEGRIRNVNLVILKSLTESCIEGFLRSRTLINEGIGYTEALDSMMDIIIKGIEI